MRRIIDIAFAMIIILLFLPFWIILAIILRFTGEGKIFYLQPRIGFEGKTFKIVKFASMLENSPNMGTGDITLRNDPRVLPVGRFLRKTKINEIPQVINLLRGEMTLIGPRPLTPKNFAFYPEYIQTIIVSVAPGLTGVGSIVFRDEEKIISDCGADYLDFVRDRIAPYKGELELWYIRNRSGLVDLKIFFLTLWVLFFHESTLFKKLLKGIPTRDDLWQAKETSRAWQPSRIVSDTPTNFQNEISKIHKSPAPLPLYVVTVNYRSEHRFNTLIQSLSLLDIEKLIVVNHSKEETFRNVTAPFPMEIVIEPNIGYGAGLNTGLRHIDHSDAAVLACNPDIELLTPGTVSDAVKYFEQNPQVACLTPRLVNSDGAPIFSARRFYTLRSVIAARFWHTRHRPTRFRREHFYADENLDDIFPVDWGSGSVLLLRKLFFPYPLSFDERFFLYFEDVDLCTQICEHGLLSLHYPHLVFKHHEQRKSAQDFFYLALHTSSLMKYVWKYGGFPQRSDIMNHLSPTLTD